VDSCTHERRRSRFTKSGAIFCIEQKERSALAFSIGVPLDVAAYGDHRLEADGTSVPQRRSARLNFVQRGKKIFL
jgi:hypothetical protein